MLQRGALSGRCAFVSPRVILASMNSALAVVATIFVAIAAVVHFYIFFLESIAWTRPRTQKVFGIRSQQDAETTKSLAFNQGFYNLFLGLGAVIGLVLLPASVAAGAALVFMCAGSMLLAALVLFVTAPANRRSALIQGTMPFFGVLFLLLAVV